VVVSKRPYYVSPVLAKLADAKAAETERAARRERVEASLRQRAKRLAVKTRKDARWTF
jgi:hypothetical protein